MATQSQEARRQLRFAIIEKYLNSGLSQEQFCQQQQLAYSMFQFWLKKYRQKKPESTNKLQSPTTTFLPLTFASPKTQPAYLVIEYPNGVMLHVNGSIEPQTLMQLIQAHGA